MPFRTPYGAVSHHADSLQLIISCLHRAKAQVSSYQEVGSIQSLTLNRGEPIRVGVLKNLTLKVAEKYQVQAVTDARNVFDIVTVAYHYVVGDEDGREILAFHWHPTGSSPIRTPHMHLGPAAQVGLEGLVNAHIPTGFVRLEEIVRLVIDDFGVRAIRDDWEQVLSSANRSGFSNYPPTFGG